jgi:hypothetical protein
MKYILALFLVMTFTFGAFAQVDNVQVDVTKLNADELRVYQALKQKQAQSAAATTLDSLTPEKVDKYAQMGKGLGVAINEGLGAVTKNVEQFSQTSAGKWLMVLITWKVMGNDAVGLVRTAVQWAIGGILFLVGVPTFIWLVRRNCVQRPILSVETLGLFKRKVTYSDRSEPIHAEVIALYGLCFLIYMGAVALITFLH